MKLQKNNKYKNKIAAGLSAIIIASAALTGCGSSSDIEITSPVETVEPTTIPEPPATPKPTPEPTPTIEEDIETLGIINEDTIISDSARFGLVFKMPDNSTKILQVLLKHEDDRSIFYDVFTEIPVISVTNYGYDDDLEIQYDEVEILVSYFENSELAYVGILPAIINYVIRNLNVDPDQLIELDNKFYGVEFGETIYSSDYNFTKKELAEYYIGFVPRENRVTAEELQTGLEKDSAKVLK